MLWLFLLASILSSFSVHSRLIDRFPDIRDHPKYLDSQLKDDEVEKDQFIVVLDDSTVDVDSTMLDVKTLLGGELDYVYNYVFKGGAIRNVQINKLRSILDLDFVQSTSQNSKVTTKSSYVQNNPPWGLDRLDQSSRPMDCKYHYSYDGTGVKIYVLDSGIMVSHAEFDGRASCGFSVFNDSCVDVTGHGTHVAGIAAGKRYGVAKNAQVIGVKVVNDYGFGTIADIVKGIDFVIEQKKEAPVVISMSIGGYFESLWNEAVGAAVDAGIVVVVPAGNEREDACDFSPASVDSAITVASINRFDFRMRSTNIGYCVDIFAPGEYIRSAFPSNNSNKETQLNSGTSMASAFVAGVAALHLQKNSSMTPSDVWTAIERDAIRNKIPNLFLPYNPYYPLETPNLILGTKSLQGKKEKKFISLRCRLIRFRGID